MLEHLRKRVETVLAGPHRVMLSTWGPADIQSGLFDCEARGLHLFLRVPRSSDHLFNLEFHDGVVVTCEQWQVTGCARVLEAPDGLSSNELPADFTGVDEAYHWSVTVEITPVRVQVYGSGEAPGETIDIDDGERVP